MHYFSEMSEHSSVDILKKCAEHIEFKNFLDKLLKEKNYSINNMTKDTIISLASDLFDGSFNHVVVFYCDEDMTIGEYNSGKFFIDCIHEYFSETPHLLVSNNCKILDKMKNFSNKYVMGSTEPLPEYAINGCNYFMILDKSCTNFKQFVDLINSTNNVILVCPKL